MLIREEWKNLKSYLRDNIAYICVAAIVVIAAYGIRAFRSSFCIDSEIMIAQPDYMKSIWLGSNRFGMYIISEICGMQRLSPYLSGFLMMLTMWITAVALGYACWNWSGKGRDSRVFVMLFPLLAVTSPLFAEQYLFILQAFEISMGLLLTVVSVYCTDRVVCILDRHTDMPGNECSWSASDDELAGSIMNAKHAKMAQLSHFRTWEGGGKPERCAGECPLAYRLDKCRNCIRNLSDLCSSIPCARTDSIHTWISQFPIKTPV